jgi:chemotaxis protein methyltransferase CheR/type IV pilus assembly protein PilK
VQTKVPEMQHLDPLPEMDELQFQQWMTLLEKRTGMVLPPERKSFLVTNLGLRMREIGCRTYQEYFELLCGVQGVKEWNTLVDRITVHETRFFRHPLSLELIQDYVANKQPNEKSGHVTVQAWSVACSTGEEAYTLGIVIDQAFKKRGAQGYFGITATDISPASLQTGRKGLYSDRRVKDIDPLIQRQYFKPAESNKYHVSDYLRKRVCFARMNVLDIVNEPVGEMDIIYCQNLLIYFDRSSRVDIVKNMVRHLLPGGLLILGSGELLKMDHPELEKINHPRVLAYRRVVKLNKDYQ